MQNSELNNSNPELPTDPSAVPSFEPDATLVRDQVSHVQASQFVSEQPRGTHRGIIIGLISFVFTLLLGAGTFGYWYLAVRVPDSEYDRAVAVIDVMVADVKSIESNRGKAEKSMGQSTTVTSIKKVAQISSSDQQTLDQLEEGKDKAVEYVANQQVLAGLKVIAEDKSVKAVYDANRRAIEGYGDTTDIYYRTGYIFMTMMAYCSAGNENISDSETFTVDDYNNEMKLCTDYIAANETVPAKEFNDSFFVPFRSLMIKLVEKSRKVLTAEPNSKAQNQAVNEWLDTAKQVAKIDTSKVNTLKPASSPQDQLQRVKDKLVERKNQFFR